MLILRLLRRLPITPNTRNSTPYRAGNTVRDTGAEIVELPFCLLASALSVLFLAGLFPILLKTLSALSNECEEAGGGERYLRTNKASNSFLGGTDGLVPGAFGAVGVVLCDGSGGGSGVVAYLGGCVGGLVLELSFVFLGFASLLGIVSI